MPLIVTATLNPSVDISYKLPVFRIDEVNRVEDVSKTPGGKGLNVSRVLKQLGEDVAATGFLGGDLGNFIRKRITKLGIQDHFVPISGETRNCIAVIHEGYQTEILEGGPEIQPGETERFLEKFAELAKKAEIITISGSLPKGLPANFYIDVLKVAKKANTPVLLDVNGKLLKETLQGDNQPFLIKPNREELNDLVGEFQGEDWRKVLGLPIFKGIEWVVVSLGAEGAIVKQRDDFYRVTIPKVKAINPVGSGDSVMAGFASGLRRGLQDEELIKYGIAMGVLNAMEEQTGCINPANLSWCMANIQVEKIV